MVNFFLNKKIHLKNPYNIDSNNINYLENMDGIFKKLINLSITEFKAIIKQSIPEATPTYYSETNLKIFNN